MPTVLIYRSELLPPSETFIQAQTASLRRYTPRFVGLRRAEPGLLATQDCFLAEQYRRLPTALQKCANDYLGLQPRLHHSRLLDDLRALKPSLLHVHFATDALAAMPLASALNLPMLITLHGYDVTARHSTRNPIRATMEAARNLLLRNRTSLFLCVSDFIRTRALDAGFPAKKLMVHRIGVDLNTFQPASTPSCGANVLFVGRLTEKKGCEYLIRAMALVQCSAPSARLIIIGDGPLRASLEQLAAELSVACDFLGRQDQADVRRHIAAARVCAIPSVTAANGDSEGLPIFLTEAQALGVPVVATRHAGIPEGIVHGAAGMLSAERDVDGLATNIRRLYTDDRLHADLSRRGVALVQRDFNLAHQTPQLEAIYDSVLNAVAAQPYSCRSARATA